MRVSPDSLRSLDVEPSRNSAEYGKGSGGVLGLNTGIGDDHFRYSGTNFVPSVQNKKGLTFDKVDPRFDFFRANSQRQDVVLRLPRRRV